MMRCLPLILIFLLGACATEPISLPGQSLPSPSILTPTAAILTITTPSPGPVLSHDLCLNSNVRAEYGDFGAKYQSVTISTILKNIGASPCNVQFFPRVRLLDFEGNALKVDYGFFKEGSNNSYLLVEPGQTVGFLIVWKNWCQPPMAGGINIQLILSETALPIDIHTLGTDLGKSAIYAAAVCTQPSKSAEVWISQFVYNVPVPLYP